MPLGEPVRNKAKLQKLAAVRVFPGADGDFALYHDDGRTYAYKKAGGFAVTRLHWNDAAGKLEVSGDASPAGDHRRVLRLAGR